MQINWKEKPLWHEAFGKLTKRTKWIIKTYLIIKFPSISFSFELNQVSAAT